MAFYDTNNIKETDNTLSNYNKDFWDSVNISTIFEIDTLRLASNIKENGYPEDSELRTAILNRFNKGKESDYPLEYEKLCNYCKSFHEAYPLDSVLYLIKTTITNMQNYTVDIYHSSLSDEEKALLFFILPL